MKKVSIIIPAHNEQERLGPTLEAYEQFFATLGKRNLVTYEFIVVLNGCTDGTCSIVQRLQKDMSHLYMVNLAEAGKGLAVKAGFADALTRDADLIGFVDADMATLPEYFYELVQHIGDNDVIIASRYMPGASVTPARPWIKRWGSWLVYESLVKLLFGLSYYDLQCGAKLFKRDLVKKIVPHIMVRQWALDVELLYVAKRLGYTICELPTVWYDRAGSKLRLSSGLTMLGALFKLRWMHTFYDKFDT